MRSMLMGACSVIASFLLLSALFVFVFRSPLLVLALVLFIATGVAGGACYELWVPKKDRDGSRHG